MSAVEIPSQFLWWVLDVHYSSVYEYAVEEMAPIWIADSSITWKRKNMTL